MTIPNTKLKCLKFDGMHGFELYGPDNKKAHYIDINVYEDHVQLTSLTWSEVEYINHEELLDRIYSQKIVFMDPAWPQEEYEDRQDYLHIR